MCNVVKCIAQKELERSKIEVAILVQKEVFPQEIRDLTAGLQLKALSHIAKLKPVAGNDGVLRVGGRIPRAPIPSNAVIPITLPKKHHVPRILIRYLHERNGHRGPEQVLFYLREQFWVIKRRAAAKEFIGKCMSRMARRMSQEMVELPKVRLTPYKSPFTFSGVY